MKKGHEKAQTDLNWIHLYLKNGSYPPGLTAIEKRIVRKRAEQFCFMNEELYFLGTVKSKEIGQVPRKVLLTNEERWNVVEKAHTTSDGTHLGLERTLEPVTDKYYWVGIHKFARDYIRQCPVCLERNPRLGSGIVISSSASVTDGSFDDGSSIGGDDSLSISGTEVVSTTDDVESIFEQSHGFARETAKAFWEMVDLRLYGPFKVTQKSKYILIALDGYSLWPEAFVLDIVSPSVIAHSILKLVCRYGQMGRLVMSQEDEVLETATLKALQLLKQEGSVDIMLTKCVVENTGELYDEFEDMLAVFVASHPNTWANCIEFCLLPLRSSCPQRADYTPSFLAHSREIQLPSVLVQNCFADTQLSESDKSLMMEPFMTMSQKKMTVDVMMGINQSVAKEAAKTPVSNDEKFVPPGQDKSVETIDNRGIVTRTRTGSVKPKQFDDENFITPVKRKANTPIVTPDTKKIKVESEVVPESTVSASNIAINTDKEEREEVPSDSESDLSLATEQSGTKLTVDLDHFYKSIRQFITNGTYLPNSVYNFKRLIRETSKQYRLQGTELYYVPDQAKTQMKVITSKEERLELLDWAHNKPDGHLGRAAMLEELKEEEVHWKGKSFDCESFALACPDCENYERKIKVALKNMQEEKKLISYDNCNVYNEIRDFLNHDVFSKCYSESLAGIRKQLNSFKIEGDQLMFITDMKKKKVVISPAERVKLIEEAHIEGGKHHDLKGTLSKVLTSSFWFGMKMDVKIFVNYCCSSRDGRYLIDRYFLFRAYFMKKATSQVEIVKSPGVTVVHAETTMDDANFTASKSDDVAGNQTENIQDKGEHVEQKVEENEKPTGIFVSTIASEAKTEKATTESAIKVIMVPPSETQITEKGDQPIINKKEICEREENNSVPSVSSDTKAQNVVVKINEGGDALSAKLAGLKSVTAQESVLNRNSDPVTMAAVKSILPEGTGAVANVLTEVEVAGSNTAPTKITSSSVEMRDSSVNTSVELVVNEDDLLNEETEDDDGEDDEDEDDEDEEDTVEVPTTTIHSELLSRLTETLATAPKLEETQKKVVKPRQYYKCNICNRVFYGPNKFKTHIYRHTGQKPFPCTMCNKKYTNSKSLIIHERTHTGELPYLCNTCGKRMASKMSLKSHLKVHDGKGGGMPCKCDICGREFTRRHLMERHRNFKHINLQTEFKCSECPKVFGHQRSLKRHFMSHHMGVKNHVCELCNKAFYRKEYLTSHMAQHSGYSVELAKKKRSPRGYKPFIKEEDQDGEEEEGQEEEEPVRRIILHQDEHGTLRVVDMATEREVKKMLDSQIVQRSEVGETMVVQIQQPSSQVEQHVIQIEQPGSKVEHQVLEIEQPGGQVEERVLQIEEPGTQVEQSVVQVENDGQPTEQVVEVPVEQESYIEYQQVEENPGAYITVSQSANPTSYSYAYPNSQADISVQANQELIYGQPAVQYEVECVGDVGDEEALSAINLLAQASAAQYENVVVSQI